MSADGKGTDSGGKGGPQWEETLGESKLKLVRQELVAFMASPLPDERRQVRSFRALCLRRDVHALLNIRPLHGVSDMPLELRSFAGLDAAVYKSLKGLDRRMATLAAGLPLNSLYGAWEGGLPVEEMPSRTALCTRSLPVTVSAFNVRGALTRDGGMETHDARILQLCSSLQAKGVLVAILSEPRFASGLVWPDWSGYRFIGERTSDCGSVAALVMEELAEQVVLVQGVGDARSIWLEIPWASIVGRGVVGKGILLLGVYAPQVGHATDLRRQFWQERQKEYMKLLRRRRYLGWGVMLVGDYNLHFACLGMLTADIRERWTRRFGKCCGILRGLVALSGIWWV